MRFGISALASSSQLVILSTLINNQAPGGISGEGISRVLSSQYTGELDASEQVP